MSTKTPELGFYYHYKHSGKSVDDYAYEVLNVAHHTEIDDFDAGRMVIYRPLYKTAKVYTAGKHWDARPLDMFMEDVTKDGNTFPRFQKISNPEVIKELKKIQVEMYGG